MGSGKTRRLVFTAFLCAAAIVLSLVESVYIGSFMFNLRLGLANIAALVALKLLGKKEMLIVNTMRVIVATLLRGLIFSSTFWISLGGVALSSISLLLSEKAKSSLMFTSVISSVCHSLGQVAVVMLFYMQPMIAAILPYLLLGSIPMGFMTGMVAGMVLKRIRALPLIKHT